MNYLFLVKNQVRNTTRIIIFTLLLKYNGRQTACVTELQIIIGKTIDEKYYFRIRNVNGRILLTSREYVHLGKCMNEIYGIQHYMDFELHEEFVRDNGYRYTLIGSWGRMVGESQFYTYSYEMHNDMSMLKQMIRRASVIDNSSTVRFFRPVRIK